MGGRLAGWADPRRDACPAFRPWLHLTSGPATPATGPLGRVGISACRPRCQGDHRISPPHSSPVCLRSAKHGPPRQPLQQVRGVWARADSSVFRPCFLSPPRRLAAPANLTAPASPGVLATQPPTSSPRTMARAQQPALPRSGPGGPGHWCCSAQSRSAFPHAGLNRKCLLRRGGAPRLDHPQRPGETRSKASPQQLSGDSQLQFKIRLRFLQCTRRGKQVL